MKQYLTLGAVAIALLAAVPAMAGQQPTIVGTYVEVRSCDVYTAACYANSEVGLTGYEAILTWDVEKGSWNGVSLAGLKVMAVLKANDTLGDRNWEEYSASAILYADERADASQKAALVAFAQEASDGLITKVIRVESAPINVTVEPSAFNISMDHSKHNHHAMSEPSMADLVNVTAGDVVSIRTRAIHTSDQHCGNESVFYPPLTNVSGPVALFTERDAFRGAGLGITWDNTGGRSTFLAKFAR